jgi:hypothetical protein
MGYVHTALHTTPKCLCNKKALWYFRVSNCDPDLVTQDVVSAVCLFAHIPNITFYDFWCGCASVLRDCLAKVSTASVSIKLVLMTFRSIELILMVERVVWCTHVRESRLAQQA